jgi:hypothetical protein
MEKKVQAFIPKTTYSSNYMSFPESTGSFRHLNLLGTDLMDSSRIFFEKKLKYNMKKIYINAINIL